MKIKILSIILLFVAGIVPVNAFNVSKAEEAYKNKNYEEAVKLFSEIMEKEGVSAGLLYDLGNCYYQLGKDGEAVLCYERARKLDPQNEMINQNLNFLSNKVIEANKGELKGKNGNLEPDQESF